MKGLYGQERTKKRKDKDTTEVLCSQVSSFPVQSPNKSTRTHECQLSSSLFITKHHRPTTYLVNEMAHPDSTIEQSAISGVTAQKQQTVTEHFCQTCDRYFASNEALQDHSLHNRKHAKKSNIPWVQKHKKLHLCRTCNKVLESKREREAHRHDEGRRQRQTTNPLPDLGLWTTIPPSNYEQTIESIRNLCHHESTLHKAQFSFNDHPALFQYAAHCQHCGGKLSIYFLTGSLTSLKLPRKESEKQTGLATSPIPHIRSSQPDPAQVPMPENTSKPPLAPLPRKSDNALL